MSDLAEYHCDRTLGSIPAPNVGRNSRCPIRFPRLMASNCCSAECDRKLRRASHGELAASLNDFP
jgi:hypothetical protein